MKKKQQDKIRIGSRVFGVMAVVAFLVGLVFLFMGISSTIGGMEEAAISKSPEVILANAGLSEDKDLYLSVAYFDQRSDECVDLYDTNVRKALAQRQFEWESCGYYNKGVEQGLVDYELGGDHLPVFQVGQLTSNRGVGSDGRWFSAVEGKSAPYTGTLKIEYVSKGARFYFHQDQFYPLDEVKFSDGDAVNKDGHNHLFTMNFAVPFTALLSGEESFEIAADDDTFVYVGDKLVMDMGGLHDATTGKFSISEEGEVYAAMEGEELAFTGVRVDKDENAIVRIFHADRDAKDSVFKVDFVGMNISVVNTKLANRGGDDGMQIAYDPTDPTYEAPLGQSVVVQPDNTRGYIVMMVIEGVMVVVFSVLIVIAVRVAIRRRQ